VTGGWRPWEVADRHRELTRRYKQLRGLGGEVTPQQRGSQLNYLLAEVLRADEIQARVSQPTELGEIDVAFRLGDTRIILEAKWTRNPIDFGPVSLLATRARQRLEGTVGVLVVWPSVRLGFRVKRAVFCGGRDLQHPFWYRPGELRWEGFAATKVYDDVGKLWIDLFRELIGRKQQQTPRRAFPTSNTYEAENAVYDALARRKPGEVPVDMLLGFPLYLWFAFAGLVVVWLIQTAAGGFDVPTVFWFLLLALLLIPVMPFNFLLQAVRNYRQRWH
jgi:hypothetical protein